MIFFGWNRKQSSFESQVKPTIFGESIPVRALQSASTGSKSFVDLSASCKFGSIVIHFLVDKLVD